jgi:APA family basic amino acid/polyamine antiporter
MTNPTPRPLRRILGLGFGLALAFGSTVGVGILRLPGTIAAALGDSRLVELCWVIGGLYALLGAGGLDLGISHIDVSLRGPTYRENSHANHT